MRKSDGKKIRVQVTVTDASSVRRKAICTHCTKAGRLAEGIRKGVV